MAPGDPLEVADLTVGMIVEAQDAAGIWYRATVTQVSEQRGAKVHYAGYKPQYDEWRAAARPNFYTGLKLSSKSHFYGRVAPEEVLAVFLSELLRARSARRGFCGFSKRTSTGAERPKRF